MNRQQIIVVLLSVAAVVLIYQLPRVVVENEVAEVGSHDFSISDKDARLFASLKQQLTESSDIKKSINFADSLAKLSLKYQMIDSAASLAEQILQLDTASGSKVKAALIYYRAFQTSGEKAQSIEMAAKAREIFEEVLADEPQNSSLKNKLAMTLITTENPMTGIQLLREVLAEDPDNREAMLNLGLLAIQSGQYKLAEERFQDLLQRDSADSESLFYLGVVYTESGDPEEGKKVFEKLIQREDVDPALKATASTYLKDLSN